MKWFISHDTIKSPFLKTLQDDCGEKVSHCYQCGKCSAGCPISFQMDYLPNQIMRMVQLGMEEQVLSSKTIWLCTSCLTCTVRCPREIDIAEIMDYLRRRARGINCNAAMRIDPYLKNTCLLDLVGGSVSFYDSKVRLVKVN